MACKACEEPLFIRVDEDGDNNETVPDDLELVCGCHFHWFVLTTMNVYDAADMPGNA